MESMNDKVRDMRSQGHWGKPHGWKMLITDTDGCGWAPAMSLIGRALGVCLDVV